MPTTKLRRAYVIRPSSTHGRGAFATRTIRKGAEIIQYRGARSTWEVARERPDSDPNDPYHTFIFELADGTVIDAGLRGNAARWFNHSCAPNCEALEDDDGRIFIHAKRTIREGEELTYDYRLRVDGPIGVRMRKAYECRCGAPRCRGTMLHEKRARKTPAKTRSQ